MTKGKDREDLLFTRLKRSEKKSYLPEDKLRILTENFSKTENELKQNKEVENVPLNLLEFAPDDINFFPEITQEKMNEMMYSIIRWGLFSPIIIWKQEDNNYMVLSGRNRVSCFKNIIDKYQDVKIDEVLKNADEETKETFNNFDVNNYKKIPAYIYEKDEISLEEAKEIVIETNFVQRDSLFKVRNKLNLERVKYLKKRRDIDKKDIEEIAKELGFTKRNFFYYQKIEESLIPELKEKFTENHLKFSVARYIATLDENSQKKLNKLGEDLYKIKDVKDYFEFSAEKGISKKTADEYLKNNIGESIKILGYRIPKDMQDDFKKHIEEFINKKDLK